ncbi:hypothetical protein PS718_00541 [Pseudomonas fluorescens]|uniref:Uncharacterized protein n=2 Tax=Pseudomonas fluorescens TaxID=294 RepID=A0A5E7A811_PSEFL|nr:hypothetical protein PS718_00541 [Pseudomonas fluorescens]
MLKRYARRHGCLTPAQLCNITTSTDFALSTFSSNAELVQWIAQRAGSFSERFVGGFYHPIASFKKRTKFEVHGTPVSYQLLRSKGAAYCSECWREGYERSIKDFKFSLNCPYHNRRYLFECPKCKKHLRWIEPLLSNCSCGYELISDSCTTEDVRPENFILQCLRNKDHESIEHLTRTLLQLQYNLSNTKHDAHDRIILNAGISIISGDEVGLENYLESVHASHPNLSPDVVSAKLALIKESTVKEVVNKFNAKIFYPLAKFPLETPATPFTLQRQQIMHAAGINFKTLKRLARERKNTWLKLTKQVSFTSSQFLPIMESIIDWRKDAKKTSYENPNDLSMEVISRTIGVSIFLATKLVRAGFITKTQSRSTKISVGVLQQFLEKYESAQCLANRLHLNLKATRAILRKHHIKYTIFSGVPNSSIFTRNDSNRIFALHQIAIREQHARYDKSHIEIISGPELGLYSSCKVAGAQLGLTDDTIRQYARAGIFSIKRCTKGILIPNSEINSFHQRYMFAREYSKIMDESRTLATKSLISLGLTPIASSKQNKCHSPLFLREEVENLAKSTKSTNALSVRETRNRLKLTNITVRHLIRTGELSIDGESNANLASVEKVANFHNTHASSIATAQLCNMPIRKVQNILKAFSVFPVCGASITGTNETLYRTVDLAERAMKLPDSHNKFEELYSLPADVLPTLKIQPLALLDETVAKYDISKKEFNLLFVKTGYVKIHCICKEKYTSLPDANKIAHILDKNLTIAMIDHLLHSRGYARGLLNEGKLKKTHAHTLPKEFNGKILITRTSTAKFLSKYPSKCN